MMKSQFKKFLGLLFAFVLTFVLAACDENADEGAKLNSIKIHVVLHDNGSATIHEYRDMTMSDYSEMYINMKNLGPSKLLDFYVKNYEPMDEWDSDASRIKKADKYAVVPDEDDKGYELVWGVGNYGDRVYEPTYQLSNFVHQLKDGQSLYWNFNTFSQFETDNIELVVEAPFALTPENVDFYGFGIEGDMKLKDGKLYVKPKGHFGEDNYLTLLMQFKDKSFIALEATDKQTLAEQKEAATEGSSYNGEKPLSLTEKIIIGTVIGVSVLAVGSVVVYHRVVRKKKETYGQIEIGPWARKKDWKPSAKIPAAGEELDLAAMIMLIRPYVGGMLNALFSTYLIQWANDQKIIITSSESEDLLLGIIDLSENEDKIGFSEYIAQLVGGEKDKSVAGAFWTILSEIADADGVIDASQLKRWVDSNGDYLTQLGNYLPLYSERILESQGYIEQDWMKVWGRKISIQKGTKKGKELVKDIDQLYQFFTDLTVDQQKSMVDNQWDELLIWSALLGKDKWVQSIREDSADDWNALTIHSPYLYYYPYFSAINHSFDHHLQNSSSYSGTSSTMSSTGGIGAGGGGGGGAR